MIELSTGNGSGAKILDLCTGCQQVMHWLSTDLKHKLLIRKDFQLHYFIRNWWLEASNGVTIRVGWRLPG